MADADARRRVIERVRERVTPDADEREAMRAAVSTLTARIEAAVSDLPVDADVVQVGSTARGTWLAGDRDIDLFVRFPADLDRETLERYGLEIGNAVLPDGHEEYAEHPYVTGEFEGFDVDLVPCYDVGDGSALQSAVDRTPHHNAYLRERIDDDLAGEMRVFKQFLKGIGVYGSNLKTEGFSGYLSELLVLEHGDVETLLAAAADWHPPVVFDPEDHATRSHDDPLVMVDPTDPARNVAAVCAAENVARLQHYARAFLSAPSEGIFEPREPEPIGPDAVRAHLDRRGTTPIAVVFDAPDLVDDQLYPQLRKSLSGVRDELARRGFEPIRATTFADERAVLFVELARRTLPSIERHGGPPVHVRAHAEGFYEAYADAEAAPNGGDRETPPGGDAPPDTYGPFVDGERYVVEREREFTDAAELLRSAELFSVGLGARVETALETEYDVLVGDEVATLSEEFGGELASYFDPRP
ncbi:CCA tRNA nucleotidyltransferase [Halobellus limi]|uniref:CCA-adding enzyme n=1 Tax=Halobellus limi TaxID=699433 RepID=A0A1H6C4B4_9EURY|nr:CCA tRNA nucleotidyltransferase [Halobellus limi]QCC48609.1 CCA tRNA nucleotidyltransferase [Halobellus limi]SEG67743.1 tRNA nucleotidyltransferase (CCA-adding enzyme) [Halobellus limi]